ncbi:cyclin-dependent kinase 4 inhibitor B-like [Petromyzon marinus]|uniref:Cyclin dependent kinase inhibitor 2D n=1 Tax=Petromyzon marinus TaxID=7757 RepID=S4RBI8_PETMA|nr:cyclin-dependent kinase 4 inhibitor B-like [Petromyzon marinus]
MGYRYDEADDGGGGKNASDGDRLSNAAARGDVGAVRELLARGVPADSPGRFGRTALQVMLLGNVSLARILLEAGADPGVQDPVWGLTPAHDAAREGFADTALELKMYGAPMWVKDALGRTPSQLAELNGHSALALALVDDE